MTSEYEDDDVLQYLPVLKKHNPPKEMVVDEYESESGWYETFINEVSDDVDPQKLHDLVLDYLICGGYREAAQLLCEGAQMTFPSPRQGGTSAVASNVESLEERNAVRALIVDGHLEEALAKIEQLAPELLRQDPTLHFKLLRQRLVELIRNKDIDKVLSFAQEYLMDKCEQPPELFTKLEQTYALLAFDEPERSPFGHLMSLSQRNVLANEVNSALLAQLNACPTSKLEHLFRLMVWNRNQLISKGEPPTVRISEETTSELCKDLFGQMMDDEESSEQSAASDSQMP